MIEVGEDALAIGAWLVATVVLVVSFWPNRKGIWGLLLKAVLCLVALVFFCGSTLWGNLRNEDEYWTNFQKLVPEVLDDTILRATIARLVPHSPILFVPEDAPHNPLPEPPEPALARKATPEVALSFVGPLAPALLIHNTSSTLVEKIKWMVVLFNLDKPERLDPLPIPTGSFDWIKAHQYGGPQRLFSQQAKALVDAGDHLAGSATVDCTNCEKKKTYILYIEWGVGGWFSEVTTGPYAGSLIVPKYQGKAIPRNYLVDLEGLAPSESRVTIKPR